MTREQALADQQSSLAGDTPLTPSGPTWADKGRFVGGEEATFAAGDTMTTGAAVLDTTRSFGVAAWVRVDAATGTGTFLSQDGTNNAAFELQYRADGSYCFAMRAADVAGAGETASCAANTVRAGLWTHVAGTFDAAEQKMRVWVDGVLKQEATAPAAWASSGSFRVGTRRSSPATFGDDFVGALADVQAYDRALVQEDFSGEATDPESGIEGERGMLYPIEVTRWNFEGAVDCYDTTIDGACQEPDSAPFDHRLRFTQGVTTGDSTSGRFGQFDDQAADGSGAGTHEYGVSQAYDSGTGDWTDAPVLRTDQSYTVTVRVHLDAVGTPETVLAPQGDQQSAFYLGTRTSTVAGVTAERFEVLVPSADATVGETYAHVVAPEALSADEPGAWHRLTIVYDASAKTMTLYVNGVRKASAVVAGGWNATGPMVVGGASHAPGSYTDQFFGGIDEIFAYQGAMTDAQVAALVPAFDA